MIAMIHSQWPLEGIKGLSVLEFGYHFLAPLLEPEPEPKEVANENKKKVISFYFDFVMLYSFLLISFAIQI